jgi:hypothetical protein
MTNLDFAPPAERTQPLPGPHNICLVCMKQATDGIHDFCGMRCFLSAQQKAPIIFPVPREHHAYQKVTERFHQGGSEGYEICFVYRIVCPQAYQEEYEMYRSELQLRPVYPGANVRLHWSPDPPCSHWQVPTAQMAFCKKKDCEMCELVNNHGPSDGDWLLNPEPPELFERNGYYVSTLCEAVLGRVFRGRPTPPFFDTKAVIARSTHTTRQGWSGSFSYILPSRGVLPSYIVWFKKST